MNAGFFGSMKSMYLHAASCIFMEVWRKNGVERIRRTESNTTTIRLFDNGRSPAFSSKLQVLYSRTKHCTGSTVTIEMV